MPTLSFAETYCRMRKCPAIAGLIICSLVLHYPNQVLIITEAVSLIRLRDIAADVEHL
jgi:hypothetical protein